MKAYLVFCKSLGFLFTALLLGGNAGATTYYWYSTTARDWALFSDPASWRTDTFGGTAVATAVPGPSDILSGKGGKGNEVPRYALDLGGQSWTVANFGNDMAGWGGNRSFDVTNGTLTITGGFRARLSDIGIWSGAKLVVPAPATFQMNDNHSGKSTMYVHDSAEVEALGPLYFYGPNDITIQAGGKASFGATFKQNSWGTTYLTSTIANEGALFLPGGLIWTSVGGYGTAYQTTVLRQKGGTLSLGGPLTRNGLEGSFQAEFSGGALSVTGGAVTFSGLDSTTVAAGFTLPVTVAEGASISFTGVTLGEGAAVTKSGLGALNLDGVPPGGVQVTEGPVWVTTPNLTLENLDFAAGTEVIFKAHGTRIDAWSNASDLTFSVDTSCVLSGQVVLRSADAAVRAAVKARTSLPTGFTLKEAGDALLLSETVPNTFDATLSSDLNNAEAWGGTIPASDQDVTIVGDASATEGFTWVEFNAASPQFKSLTLKEGAGLRVTGGTEEEPLDLPKLHEVLRTKVLVTEGACAYLTNGLENTAMADALPVFEISTNAVVKVPGALKGGSPSYTQWGYIFVPGTMCFRNVDLRLYGVIELPEIYTAGTDYTSAKGTSSANKGYSRIIFGWADANETTYFAMTAIGGQVKVSDGTIQYEGSHSRVEFVTPASGGCVKVIGDILLKDFAKDIGNAGGNANSGYYFGAYNPASEVFNVILDHTELRPLGPSFIGGGTQLKLRNGAVWSPRATDVVYTLTHGLMVAQSATISLEGSDTLFARPHYTQWNSYGNVDNPYGNLWRNFLFRGTGLAGTPRISLKDGATLNVWDFGTYGTVGDAYAHVSGGYWNVDKPCGINNDSGRSYTQRAAVFAGFKRVELAADTTFTVRATDAFPDRVLWDETTRAAYPNWTVEAPREARLEIPVTGAGNLAVTNGLPTAKAEYSMTLLVTNGANTATGTASATTSANGGVTRLVFADGATWAGTVVANGNVSLTNLVAAAAPATVTFGGFNFVGTFPIRLWADGSSDFVELTGDSTSVSGGLQGVGMEAYVPQPGDAFVVARCPATAALPTAARGWKVRTAPDPEDAEKVLVSLVCAPSGTQIMLR